MNTNFIADEMRAIRQLVKPRNSNTTKANYGHALLIAGSIGKIGAAVITARACLRSGVGLLTVNIPEAERTVLQIAVPEAMCMLREKFEDEFTYFSAIGIGPGIGTHSDSLEILTAILTTYNKPLVLDADALNCIAAHPHLLHKIPVGSIITPHSIEFDRLFGIHETSDARTNSAIVKAEELNLVIVLKSSQTVITHAKKIVINTTGNAGLAKGGSGDALTGIITAFLAQGYTSFEAAKLGVYIHGLAADIALKNQSTESMLITDVIECLGLAFKQIENS